MNKFLKTKLLIIIFIIFSFHAFTSDKQVIILKDNLFDYVLDCKSNTLLLKDKKINIESEITPGYYFVCNNTLLKYSNNTITNIKTNKEEIIYKTESILPILNCPNSLQHFTSKNALFIPTANSTIWINTSDKQVKKLPDLPIQFPSINIAIFPKFFLINSQLMLLSNYKLYTYSNNKFKVIAKFPKTQSLGIKLCIFNKGFAVLNALVTRGELSSFRTEISYFSEKFEKTKTVTVNGIFKEGGSDLSGNVLIAYKKTSIISGLFGKNKVHFKFIDKKKKVKTETFTVSHKRNHIFFYQNNNLQVCALIQCKNGDIYTYNPHSNTFKKEKFKFNYNYTFLRGLNGGYFFDKKHNTYTVVSFNTNN